MAARTVGVIGLGHVGRALAARASEAGLPVQGFDVSAAAIKAARTAGVAVALDLAALLDACSVALVCVFDDAQLAEVVRVVVEYPGGVAATELLINAATCSPAAAEAAADRLEARGIAFLELPLSGSSQQIRDGEALGLVGADQSVLARYADLVAVLSPQSFHVGPPGAGAKAKLASNLVLGLNRAALAEGIVLAERLGLDGHRFLELLRRSPAYSRAVDSVGERMVARDFTVRSRLAQHRKDLALILAQAQGSRPGGHGAGHDLSLPLARAHLALLDRAVALGFAESDNAAVIAALTTSADSADVHS
jgi:3-hydroxyisobutyrate dehydrogenase-like beta-hydroxyacid dehydrogenase